MGKKNRNSKKKNRNQGGASAAASRDDQNHIEDAAVDESKSLLFEEDEIPDIYNYKFEKSFGPKLGYDYICITCLKDRGVKEKLYCCERCNLRLYCSETCQKKSWQGIYTTKTKDYPPHKNWCLAVKEIDNEAAKLTEYLRKTNNLDSCFQSTNMPLVWKYSKLVYKAAIKKHGFHEAVLSCIQKDTQRYRDIIDNGMGKRPMGSSFVVDRFCNIFLRGKANHKRHTSPLEPGESEWSFRRNPNESQHVTFDEKRLLRFLNHGDHEAWNAWMYFLETVTDFFFQGYCNNMNLSLFLNNISKSLRNCQLALVNDWVARFVLWNHAEITWKFICHFHHSYISSLEGSRDASNIDGWREDLILAAVVKERGKEMLGSEFADKYFPLSQLKHDGVENLYNRARIYAFTRIESKSTNGTFSSS